MTGIAVIRRMQNFEPSRGINQSINHLFENTGSKR